MDQENELNAPEARSVPSDKDIAEQLRRILQGSDLTVVTPKTLRVALEHHYGMPLKDRKGYIKEVITAYMSEKKEEEASKAPEGALAACSSPSGSQEEGEENDDLVDSKPSKPLIASKKRKALFGSLFIA
jgi:hypothetical protein